MAIVAAQSATTVMETVMAMVVVGVLGDGGGWGGLVVDRAKALFESGVRHSAGRHADLQAMPHRLPIGIADDASTARVQTCRYSK